MAKQTTKRKRNHRYKTVHGVVSPAEWDDDDRVTGVVITADDDTEYFVDPRGKGEFLLDLIDEHVQASGIVHNDDGDYTIFVEKFRQSSGSQVNEDDEDDDDKENEDDDDQDDDDEDDDDKDDKENEDDDDKDDKDDD
jgi:hypothetical protein